MTPSEIRCSALQLALEYAKLYNIAPRSLVKKVAEYSNYIQEGVSLDAEPDPRS